MKPANSEGIIMFDKEDPTILQQKIDLAIKERYDNPWLNLQHQISNYSYINLHNEIIDYVDYIQQPQDQKQKRKEIYAWIKHTILTSIADSTVKMFGSSATGLDLPNSDIDIVVINESVPVKKMIKALENAFNQQKKRIGGMEVLKHTKVPLIKLVEKETGINIDISFNITDGYRAIKIIKKIMQKYPHFKYLVIVLKTFLKVRRLNETYTGGIGSFLLQLMVLAYLQYEYKEREYNIQDFTLSEALIGFLEFYSSKFNHERLTIVVEREGAFIDKSLVEGAGEFSLLNPFDPATDIGKSAHRIHKVFRAFEKAKESLFYSNEDEGTTLQRFFGSVINIE